MTLTLAALVALAVGAQDGKCGSCGGEQYGTAVEWQDSPSEAARKAKAEEKLVFVLHVSGHFEDPKFT